LRFSLFHRSRLFAASFVFALLCVDAGSANASTAANNASCSKVGVVKVINSKRFRCTITSGKKSWKLVRSTGIPPRVIPEYEKLYYEIRDRAIASGKKSYTNSLEWIISPTITPARQQMAKDQILNTLTQWFEIGIETRGLRVFILDENGSSLYQQKVLERPNCQSMPASAIGFHSGAQIGWGDCLGSRDGMLVMMLGSSIVSWGTATLEHEVAHLGQMGLLLRGLVQHDRPHINDQTCWIYESEASLFQNIFGGDVDGYRNTAKIEWRKLRDRYSLNSNEAWLSFLLNREEMNSPDCWEGSYRYNAALLIYEKIYIDFGSAKVTNWRVNSAIIGWKAAFEAEFGKTTAEWYSTSAIPYIIDQIK
jgi:hypothetical protein